MASVAQENAQPKPPIAVTLVVRAGTEVHAQLWFKNVSRGQAYLYRPMVPMDGPLKNDLFKIETDGKRIKYKGILAKRRAPAADDFMKLNPADEIFATVRLDDAYAFAPGLHVYQIWYTALMPKLDRTGFIDASSNRVRISVKIAR